MSILLLKDIIKSHCFTYHLYIDLIALISRISFLLDNSTWISNRKLKINMMNTIETFCWLISRNQTSHTIYSSAQIKTTDFLPFFLLSLPNPIKYKPKYFPHTSNSLPLHLCHFSKFTMTPHHTAITIVSNYWFFSFLTCLFCCGITYGP